MNPRDWHFSASNTHLYPGARLQLLVPEDDTAAPRQGDSLSVAFADLGAAHGRVDAISSGAFEVAMRSHTTAKGTSVAARRWEIVFDASAGIRAGCKVRRRIAAA
jgi:hypothetical protein